MKKSILIIVTTFISGLCFSQKEQVYDSPNYSINIPTDWKATNDNDIINIFPTSEVGAVTISEYHDLNLPIEETKKFILALYQSSDDENKVKSNKGKKGYSEYFYEYFDENEKVFWITKVFQKEKDLYLLSINCGQKYWNGNYMNLFNQTLNSFKIKK
ncbi:hypothetical protein D1632_09035 [Chryseobacterium nematophagum]|uniref:DUF1795 domain-containing protein n=1 Tax=Chryseobacterium nematophagum TaxID=2305228 RepID=A0A3M7LAG8_9FLAO|nr:hypothetical protein [Chryseobacterium nematophagum]RMZ59753.1 hypothetical protein D1632_09035 [Chryseobacterium nematophagum]